MTYTTKDFKDVTDMDGLIKFLFEIGDDLNKVYPAFKTWKNFNIRKFLRNGRFIVCYRDEEPVGVMLSRLTNSLFNPELVILKQDLLYAKPNTRAAYYLLNEFLDFGKLSADHIITTIGTGTNIKRQSLEKYGFKKLEEDYRLEV